MSVESIIILEVKDNGDGKNSTVRFATPDHAQGEVIVRTSIVNTVHFRPTLIKLLASNRAVRDALEAEI